MTQAELFYCGRDEVAQKPYHYKECGLDNIFLMNGFDINSVDGDDYVNIHNVDGLWKAIGMGIVANRKTFTPQEIRFLRSQMDMTQSELGALLRVDDQTVARWEKKQCKLPGPADLALRVLFLSSEVAQPEGDKILSGFRKFMAEVVARDEPLMDNLHFVHAGRSDDWEAQRLYA